jgi:hypothetical protein
MDPDGDKQIKISKREAEKITFIQRCCIDVSSVFQSFRVRCGSIYTDIADRKFMESELRVVLYCGILFWTIYLLYEAIK